MFASLMEIKPDAVKNEPVIEKARATKFHAMSSFSLCTIVVIFMNNYRLIIIIFVINF